MCRVGGVVGVWYSVSLVRPKKEIERQCRIGVEDEKRERETKQKKELRWRERELSLIERLRLNLNQTDDCNNL